MISDLSYVAKNARRFLDQRNVVDRPIVKPGVGIRVERTWHAE